jgi:hypothetical protein
MTNRGIYLAMVMLYMVAVCARLWLVRNHILAVILCLMLIGLAIVNTVRWTRER